MGWGMVKLGDLGFPKCLCWLGVVGVGLVSKATGEQSPLTRTLRHLFYFIGVSCCSICKKYRPALVLLQSVHLWLPDLLLASKPSLSHEVLRYREMQHRVRTTSKALGSPAVKNALQL